jgi:hypothetical protein
MGLLANGILGVGDIPHLAALTAPRRLLLAGSVSPQGKKLGEKEVGEAFGFTSEVYRILKAVDALSVREKATPAEMVTWLTAG